MPDIDELLKNSEKKKFKEFKKSNFRAYNYLEQIENQQVIKNNEEILDIEPSNIIRWQYKDRPENELADIDELAKTFKAIGQQQPCILRKSKEFPDKYELIVGERRWRAAEKAGLPLKSIIKDIDDKTSALIQAVENEKRADLSEFARGMSFADKIEKGLLAQRDLVDILNINRMEVSRLLSYRKIPPALFDAINDFRKVSSRTASEIVRLSHKSEAHLKALIEMAEPIREGKYGQKRIERELERALSEGNMVVASNKKITSNDGRHLFTWRLDNNSIPSIHFPKDIIELLNNNSLNFESITTALKEFIEKDLTELKSCNRAVTKQKSSSGN